jgi:hypothetical protein
MATFYALPSPLPAIRLRTTRRGRITCGKARLSQAVRGLPQLQEAYASNGLTGRRGKERMPMHRDIEKRIMLSVPRPFHIAPYPTTRWVPIGYGLHLALSSSEPSPDKVRFGDGVGICSEVAGSTALRPRRLVRSGRRSAASGHRELQTSGHRCVTSGRGMPLRAAEFRTCLPVFLA